ncbi:hypothetical protein DQ04_00391020 [Trypanosoma grayi]|uniref:hypothetical protein n=1 Tax=Trypanosoma grayi TaxID=71804 RepID=UPI0004F4A744|nr:hypothetical protein DQ04_00391020 [Trypanosoma grayi]KEG14580.1 hypothetical protein DQ04_00391020 [Trypanosoma grayi]
MHVLPGPPPHVFCRSAEGAVADDGVQDRSQHPGGLAARLRGPPQTEKLLSLLAETLVSDKKNEKEQSSKRNQSSPLLCSNGDLDDGLTVGCTTPLIDADFLTQEAFLNDLCLFLASGKRSMEGVPAVEAPLALCGIRKGQNRKACMLFSRLARSQYWRRKVLLSLLRQWRQNSGHAFCKALLLQTITDTIAGELFLVVPSSEERVMLEQPTESSSCEVAASPRSHLHLQVMQELEELVKETGSFRGMCLAVDITLRRSSQLLVEQVRRIVGGLENKDGDTALEGHTLTIIESAVDATLCKMWEDVLAFLSRCVSDAREPLRESLWVFLTALASSYAGALIALEGEAPATNEGAIQLRALRMFVEKIQRDLLDYLTLRLSKDRVAADESLITVHNVVCHYTFFWRAAMEVELVPDLLPPALSSKPAVLAWARQQASTVWGRAMRLVQSLVFVQEAAEEAPGADAVTSDSRRCQRQLLEEYVERLSVLRLPCLSGTKRARTVEEGVEEVGSEAAWLAYTTNFFLRTYHPSCFTILSLVQQDNLVALLRELHAVIVNEDRESIGLSLEKVLPSHDGPVAEAREVLLQWHVRHVQKRMVRALSEEAPLLMCLLCAVFTLLERVGKTNLNIHSILAETLLPMLVKLCGGLESRSGVEGDDDDDAENYFEQQQSLTTLIASGFLSLPWELRGLRLRLLLHRVIGASVVDCFSAEEALAEVDRIFALYADGRQTPEEAAAALCGDLTCDPFMQLLAAEGEAATKTDAIDELLRREAPVQFPAPCGTLLLMSVFRTLSLRLLELRAEWEQQEKLAGEGTMDYLGRQSTYCTTRDIVMFRFLLQMVHRMVFGFQLQPVGLLRLWLSYLAHLFTHIVPPLTENDEVVLMERATRQEGTEKSCRYAYRRSSAESSQGELRAVLGELLADLALMPLVDGDTAVSCPPALPHRPGSEKWRHGQSQKSREVLLLQRVLPVVVLEELCFVLKISTEKVSDEGTRPELVRHAGKMTEKSFLGVLGVVAFCQRLELFVVPESISDRRFTALLRLLWSAVGASSTMGST